ncbi:hypothetical protein G7Y79_00110g101650 [Physcia stellaris]|nr:hypothetical protein G7Y79_00110g101650 [Physcia stellaris]
MPANWALNYKTWMENYLNDISGPVWTWANTTCATRQRELRSNTTIRSAADQEELNQLSYISGHANFTQSFFKADFGLTWQIGSNPYQPLGSTAHLHYEVSVAFAVDVLWNFYLENNYYFGCSEHPLNRFKPSNDFLTSSSNPTSLFRSSIGTTLVSTSNIDSAEYRHPDPTPATTEPPTTTDPGADFADPAIAMATTSAAEEDGPEVEPLPESIDNGGPEVEPLPESIDAGGPF